jgi:hypothetical protein
MRLYGSNLIRAAYASGVSQACLFMGVRMDPGAMLLTRFHPEIALFRNLGVNLRNYLCDVHMYVSAQFLDFLDLAKNCSFLKWKPLSA